MQKLIDNIIELNEAIDSYWNGNKTENDVKRITSVQRKSAKIIKAYYDFYNEI